MTGVSLVVRTLALQAVLIVVTVLAAHQGNADLAAHQIAFRAWTLLAFALDAIAILLPRVMRKQNFSNRDVLFPLSVNVLRIQNN